MQIWNMDKTGFILSSKLEKVIAKKGAHQVHKVAHRTSHEYISAVQQYQLLECAFHSCLFIKVFVQFPTYWKVHFLELRWASQTWVHV